MTTDALIRVASDVPEILDGINRGIYNIWGGVVRKAKGTPGAGQIVGHLKMPTDVTEASNKLSELSQVITNNNQMVQSSLQSLQMLQYANLAMSGLNLAVSVAGFAIVCSKLNSISQQLSDQSQKLDRLLLLTKRAGSMEMIRDSGKFNHLIKNVYERSERKDVDGLRDLRLPIDEQYEITKELYRESLSWALSDGFSETAQVVESLQKRMMYFGLANSFVCQQIGESDLAIKRLQELRADWIEINSAYIDQISANDAYIEQLTQADASSIVSIFEYRKQVDHAIEYQENLLELSVAKPEVLEFFNSEAFNYSEIYFIAA